MGWLMAVTLMGVAQPGVELTETHWNWVSDAGAHRAALKVMVSNHGTLPIRGVVVAWSDEKAQENLGQRLAALMREGASPRWSDSAVVAVFPLRLEPGQKGEATISHGFERRLESELWRPMLLGYLPGDSTPEQAKVLLTSGRPEDEASALWAQGAGILGTFAGTDSGGKGPVEAAWRAYWEGLGQGPANLLTLRQALLALWVLRGFSSGPQFLDEVLTTDLRPWDEAYQVILVGQSTASALQAPLAHLLSAETSTFADWIRVLRARSDSPRGISGSPPVTTSASLAPTKPLAAVTQGERVSPPNPMHASDGTTRPRWKDMLLGLGIGLVVAGGFAFAFRRRSR